MVDYGWPKVPEQSDLVRGSAGNTCKGSSGHLPMWRLTSDTIRIRWEITDTADDTNHTGYGLVTTAFQVVIQDEKPVFLLP